MGDYSVIVTYTTKHGKVKTVGTKASRVGIVSEMIEREGGQATEVRRGDKVIAKAEPVKQSTAERSKELVLSAMTPGSTETKQKAIATTIVGSPTEIYKKETNVPEDVKTLGLSEEYKEVSYAVSKYPVLEQKATEKFQQTAQKRFEQLPPKEQFSYALKYGGLKNIPVSQYKTYVGGQEYLQSQSDSEKQRLLKRYMKEPEWEQYKTSGKGHQQIHAVAQSISERKITEPQEIAWKVPFTDIELYRYTQPEWQAKLNIGTTTILDYSGAEEQIARQKLFSKPEDFKGSVFSSLAPRTRLMYSYAEAGIKAVTFPITLPQTAVKMATGGKTLFLPDVSKEIDKKLSIGAPPGAISATVSEGITLGKSDAYQRYGRDPWAGAAATMGEIHGFMVAGYGISKAKAGMARGAEKLSPGIHTKLAPYRPTNIMRKGYWKVKEKLGRAEYVPESQVWDKLVLADKKRFAELQGAKTQFKAFQKTRTFTETGDILGIHASPHKFRTITKLSKGSSETPGLSISAYGRGSPHFLKVEGYGYQTPSKISLLPRIKMPTAPVFKLKEVFRLPKNIRKADYSTTGKYIIEQPKGPYAWIAPKSELGGPELEAIIRGGTFAKKTSSFYYTSYKGVTVPLPQYKIYGNLPKTFTSKISKTVPSHVKEFTSTSYAYGSSVPIFSPYSLTNVAVSSVKPVSPSRISSKTSLKLSSVKSSLQSSLQSMKKYRLSSPTVSLSSNKLSSAKSSVKSNIGSSTISSPSSPPSMPSSSKNSISSSFTFPPYKPSRSFYYKDKPLKPKKPLPLIEYSSTKYLFRKFNIKPLLKGVKT